MGPWRATERQVDQQPRAAKLHGLPSQICIVHQLIKQASKLTLNSKTFTENAWQQTK